jgi:hypothetical protein
VRRCIRDGGGGEELFEHGLAELLEKFAQEQQAIHAGTFHAANGGLTYLVSGRKPQGKRCANHEDNFAEA